MSALRPTATSAMPTTHKHKLERAVDHKASETNAEIATLVQSSSGLWRKSARICSALTDAARSMCERRYHTRADNACFAGRHRVSAARHYFARAASSCERGEPRREQVQRFWRILY